jgi:hypothetical protein
LPEKSTDMKIKRDSKVISVKGMISLVVVIAIVVLLRDGFIDNGNRSWALLAVVPLLIILLAANRKGSRRKNMRVRRHYSQLN